MKARLLVVLSCVCLWSLPVPVWAEEEQKTGEGKADGSESAVDPWATPKASEESQPAQPQEQVQVVQPSSYPRAQIDRPLALPEMTLEGRLQFDMLFFQGRGASNMFGLNMGAGLGIMEHLEAGLLFPLMLSPDAQVNDMPLYALYELDPLTDDFRWAGRLTLYLPFHTDFSLLADVPVKYKLHDMFAAVGEGGVGFRVGDLDHFLVHLMAGLLAQPTEALALYLTLGLDLYLGDYGTELVPLHIKGQYTPIDDLDLFVDFGFFDLGHGADILQLLIGAAYRYGL